MVMVLLITRCYHEIPLGEWGMYTSRRPGNFRRGADSFDKGANIWFSGYY